MIERLEEIAVLWNRNMPSSRIAKELGMTKGSVCGMMFRARMAGDTRFPSRPAVFGPRPRREKPVREVPPDLSHFVKPKPRLSFGKVLLMDLRPNECRYPTETLKHRGEYFFCGAPKDPKSEAYCEKHQKLCVAGMSYVRRYA